MLQNSRQRRLAIPRNIKLLQPEMIQAMLTVAESTCLEWANHKRRFDNVRGLKLRADRLEHAWRTIPAWDETRVDPVILYTETMQEVLKFVAEDLMPPVAPYPLNSHSSRDFGLSLARVCTFKRFPDHIALDIKSAQGPIVKSHWLVEPTYVVLRSLEVTFLTASGLLQTARAGLNTAPFEVSKAVVLPIPGRTAESRKAS